MTFDDKKTIIFDLFGHIGQICPFYSSFSLYLENFYVVLDCQGNFKGLYEVSFRIPEYNRDMDTFKFSVPIVVRYGDLDPQWHVNNARFLTFLEHARIAYLMKLGLFDGENFFDFNLIVADIHISYRAPITIKQEIKVWLRTAKIGNKSLTFAYEIRDNKSGQILATAESIMVTYDYRQQTSIPVPTQWRNAISALEEVEF